MTQLLSNEATGSILKVSLLELLVLMTRKPLGELFMKNCKPFQVQYSFLRKLVLGSIIPFGVFDTNQQT